MYLLQILVVKLARTIFQLRNHFHQVGSWSRASLTNIKKCNLLVHHFYIAEATNIKCFNYIFITVTIKASNSSQINQIVKSYFELTFVMNFQENIKTCL